MDNQEQQQKEQALFARNLRHDLKAPIRSIKNYCTFIEEDFGPELNANITSYLTRIKTITESMDYLVDSIAEFMKLRDNSNNYQKIDLNEIITAIINSNSDEYVIVNFQADEPVFVMGDKEALIQALQKIIDNSIRYNNNATKNINIELAKKDQQAVIIIEDNGIGIGNEYLNVVFEPFKRLQSSSDYPGVGLGLSISQKIINYHQGKIVCQLNTAEKLQVVILLPIVS